jgi:hypothetical protein
LLPFKAKNAATQHRSAKPAAASAAVCVSPAFSGVARAPCRRPARRFPCIPPAFVRPSEPRARPQCTLAEAGAPAYSLGP